MHAVCYPGCQRFVLRGFRSRSMPRPASHEAGHEKPLAPRVAVGQFAKNFRLGGLGRNNSSVEL